MDMLSSQEVLSAIYGIYPEFQEDWEFGGENRYLNEDGSFSLHAVYMTFHPFFAANARASSPAQLQWVAALLNATVEAGGRSENAVSTCFLEHTEQVRVREILSPLLNPAASARFNAEPFVHRAVRYMSAALDNLTSRAVNSALCVASMAQKI